MVFYRYPNLENDPLEQRTNNNIGRAMRKIVNHVVIGSFLVANLTACGLFGGKKNTGEHEPLNITITAPSSIQTGQEYQAIIQSPGAQGNVEARYFIERDGARKLLEMPVLTPTNNTVADTLYLTAGAVGEETLIVELEDPADRKFDQASKEATITVLAQPNSPANFAYQGNAEGSYEKGTRIQGTQTITDQDGNKELTYITKTPSQTTTETLTANSTSTNRTIDLVLNETGEYQLITKQIDNNNVPSADTLFFSAYMKGDTHPGSIQATFPNNVRVGNEAQAQFKFIDQDGNDYIGIITAPNTAQADTLITDLNAKTDHTETLTITPTEKGSQAYQAFAVDQDGFITTSNIEEVTFLAQEVQREIAVELRAENALAGVDVEINRDGKTYQATTNQQGIATFTDTVAQDSAITYQARAQAHGLQDKEFTIASTGSTEVQEHMVVVQPSIEPLADVDPYSVTQENLEQRIDFTDPDTGIPINFNATLTQQGNTFITQYLSAKLWEFATNNQQDPENITENFTIAITATYFTGDLQTTKRVGAKASIQGNLPNLTITEKDSAEINLYELFSSQANISGENIDITQAELESLSPEDMSLREVADGVYMIRAHTGNNATITATLHNAHGVTREVEKTINGELLPEVNFTVHDNVTDAIILEETYAVRENKQGETFVPVDTLWTQNGTFENIDITTEYIRVGMQRNGKNFAYEHRFKPEQGGIYEVVITPFIKRDAQGNAIGEWTYDEMSRRHSDMQRTWSNGTYGKVNQSEQRPDMDGLLPRWNTPNGQPEQVILADNLELQYYFVDGFGQVDPDSLIVRFADMSDRDMELVPEWYENETRKVNPSGNPKLPQLPELTIVGEDPENPFLYQAFDRPANKVYILPNSDNDARAGISLSANQAPFIYGAFIQLQSGSENDPGVSGQYYSFTQESMAALGERGSRPAVDLTKFESGVHNGIAVDDMQWFPLNRFASWITNNTGYQADMHAIYKSAPNEGKFSNAIILPEDN